jgi:hypothetical protein
MLKLGAGAALVLALAGGAVSLVEPGVRTGRLTPSGRVVFGAMGRALLDGSLPEDAGERDRAVSALLDRIDTLVSQLPPHAQSELSDLLAVLASAPGRAWLAKVHAPWNEASRADTQQGLQSMRMSRLALARQGYQALHDIAGAAWFSEPATWRQLGYPGPVKV